MAENFYSILTAVGLAKIANAQVSGNKVDLTQIAVGDGGGTYYNPTQNDTQLKNEVWRGNIGSVEIDHENPNWIVIESYIPSSVGGFTVREVGIFDAEGDMIAIGKYPQTFKPSLEEGASKDLLLRMIIEVTNASAVTMKVDPSVIIASRKYVDEKVGVVSNNLMQLQQEFMSHSADTTKHVTQAEKNAWNSAEANAIKYAKDRGVGGAVGIPGGTDLNTLVQQGTYLFSAGSALINAPMTGAAFITVLNREDGTIPIQIFNRVYQNRMFVRSRTGATSDSPWNNWQEVEYTNSAQAKANIAETNAKSYTDQQLAAKFTYLNINMIDVAVELETLKGATLNGVTANIFIETFQNLDDINLTNGVYDSVNKRLVV